MTALLTIEPAVIVLLDSVPSGYSGIRIIGKIPQDP